MYARIGRPSVPPEHLLKATVLMAMYSIRSERQFCERLRYDLLFKWFLDLNVDDAGFDHSTFTRTGNGCSTRDRGPLLRRGGAQAQLRRYLSGEHFSVDGTLLEAWASHKSFRPKDDGQGRPPPAGRNAEVDYHGERRSNETHQSTTDPEARLARKGSGGGQAELRRAPAHGESQRADPDMELTPATGYAERDTALSLAAPAAEERAAANGGG